MKPKLDFFWREVSYSILGIYPWQKGKKFSIKFREANTSRIWEKRMRKIAKYNAFVKLKIKFNIFYPRGNL